MGTGPKRKYTSLRIRGQVSRREHESHGARVVAAGLAESARLLVLPTFVDQLGPWSDAPGELYVEVGDPARGLAEVAERHDASLIAVGTRGRGAPLGSVARELIATSHVPMMIVPRSARLPYLACAGAAELAAA
ncbi:MAG: universal stress protein [Actinomycetota bacterium]|nr:universal stress protein [Actinomycetota bacterium]